MGVWVLELPVLLRIALAFEKEYSYHNEIFFHFASPTDNE